jgi:hypothetical protein
MLNGTNFEIEQILIDFKFSQIFKFEHILNGTDFQIWTYFKWNRFQILDSFRI